MKERPTWRSDFGAVAVGGGVHAELGWTVVEAVAGAVSGHGSQQHAAARPAGSARDEAAGAGWPGARRRASPRHGTHGKCFRNGGGRVRCESGFSSETDHEQISFVVAN